jgi:hypothetical protein
MASHAALLQTVSIDLNASVAYFSNVTMQVTSLHLTLSYFVRGLDCIIIIIIIIIIANWPQMTAEVT